MGWLPAMRIGWLNRWIFLLLLSLTDLTVCLKHYGDSYRAYMERVPRYSLFF
jgi:hypothetical protein